MTVKNATVIELVNGTNFLQLICILCELLLNLFSCFDQLQQGDDDSDDDDNSLKTVRL